MITADTVPPHCRGGGGARQLCRWAGAGSPAAAGTQAFHRQRVGGDGRGVFFLTHAGFVCGSLSVYRGRTTAALAGQRVLHPNG